MSDTAILTIRSTVSQFETLSCDLREHRAQVLITVAQGKGSTPRDAGARMWVGAGGPIDTIGGGHLELQAIKCAQDMLVHASPRRQVVRYSLGPSLGQCCGGSVWLMFEYLDHADLPWCEAIVLALKRGSSMRRKVGLLGDRAVQVEPAGQAVGLEATRWDERSGVLTDTVAAPSLNVIVCGAGHVGHAIVRLLGDLPVQVVWLDPRADYLPGQTPDNVRCIQGDASDVIDLPDHAYWLVLTHSHALDFDIVRQVLQHKSFRYLGLIGSKTKKARFVSRLKQWFPDELVQRMQCPIGSVATSSKLPGVIAVSVVAQLIPLIEV